MTKIFLKVFSLIVILITINSCLVKHHEYKLVDLKGNEIILWGDSIQNVKIYGRLTEFNDAIGSKDYKRNEDVKLTYVIKGFESVNVEFVKIKLSRINSGNLIDIKKGSISFAWDPNNYSPSKTTSLSDSINYYENSFVNPQGDNYFLIIETDTKETDGLDKMLVESNINFKYKEENIKIKRLDTLYRNDQTQMQLRIH